MSPFVLARARRSAAVEPDARECCESSDIVASFIRELVAEFVAMAPRATQRKSRVPEDAARRVILPR